MPNRTLTQTSTTALALVLLLSAGCGEDFPPYSELTGLRVMGIRSAQPWLPPGEETALEALVHAPGEAPVTYEWSWCPAPEQLEDRIGCALPHENLESMVREASGDPNASVPGYDLGTTSGATLPAILPIDAVAAVCNAIDAQGLPTILEDPECTFGMEVAVLLTVRQGGAQIHTFSRVLLLADRSAPTHQNPTLGAVEAVFGQDITVLTEDAPVPLHPTTPYNVQIALSEATAETFVDPRTGDIRREQLTLTWFITGGESDTIRTGFLGEPGGLAEAGRNVWKTPGSGDHALFVVVRDDRGGTGWAQRRISLMP